MRCTFLLEKRAYARGRQRVAGLDEAGRGCLFGPVYAACVVLDPVKPIRGLNDSKQLDAETRERLAGEIRTRALSWAVASVGPDEIDRINILQASRRAMKLALDQIAPAPDYLLVDAVSVDSAIEQEPLIHGDARSRSIAAASILAKVERDHAMEEWDRIYPGYGLASHKGYGTPKHIRALEAHGPTPHHRMSFEPVRVAAGLGQMSLFA